MNHIRGSVILLMIVCSAAIAHAQLVTSNMQGVITDSSGAVIAGASITASDSETGVRRTTTTNADGFYRLNLLPRGQYEVQAEKSGFAAERLKVTLTVGDTITANLVLKVAGSAEQVNVTSLAAQVDTSTSQIEQPVSQVQIANLPINDRNFQQLANLIPGVAPSPSYDPTKRLYGGVVSGGATARSSGISVDGGNFNDNIVGGPVGLSCVPRPKEGRTGGARGLTLTMRHSAPASLIWAAHLLISAAFITETSDVDCSEMRINWVTFLKLKGEPQLRSLTLCGLSTIAVLEQT